MKTEIKEDQCDAEQFHRLGHRSVLENSLRDIEA
jgi:hypothetical protein